MICMKQIKIKKKDVIFYSQIGILAVLILVLLFNINFPGTAIGTVSASSIIPTGMPAIYGEELGIKYDFVSPSNQKLADDTITLLGNIDRAEELDGPELQRYIYILYEMNKGISCEYCCGARSIIFENGQPACGCAHSYAMRGLTKYLIKYHGDEFTDEQILTEVGKWKVLFFPGILEGKADVMKSQGIPTDYINLTTNKYRGIEQGKVSGDMIGDC